MTRMPLANRFASVRVGIDTLTANPLRTSLSTLGIVMGSASLVAVLAVGDGLEQYLRSQLERTTDLQSISISPQQTRQVDGQRFLRSDTIHLDIAEARAIVAGVPGIATTSLMLTGPAEVVSPKAAGPHAALVTGIWYEGAGETREVAAGRTFSAAELAGADPLAIVSDTLARSVSGTAAGAVGSSLAINGAPFTIIGVLARREFGERPAAAVPFGSASAAIPPGLAPRAPTLVVAAAKVESTTALRHALEARLTARYGDWKDRIRMASNAARLDQVRQGLLVFKMVMGAITGISLLVGGVGIMNVLLAAVVERTREIGIRKAAGARKRDILIQFLAESVAIAGAGSVLGVLIGLGGAFGISAVVRARTQAQIYAGFAWSSVLISALAAVTVGLAFGTYPALRAARLSPIDAIRHE